MITPTQTQDERKEQTVIPTPIANFSFNNGAINNPTHRWKIVFVGGSGSGKTSYLKRLQTNKFEIWDYNSTIGGELALFHVVQDMFRIRIACWDTAGQEAFRSISRNYFRDTNGCIIMFDLTRIDTWKEVEYWLNEAKTNTNTKVKYIIVGNKVDIYDEYEHEISKLMPYVTDLCNKNEMPFYMVSAKTGQNIKKSFAGLIKIMYDNMDKTGIKHENNKRNYIKLDRFSNETGNQICSCQHMF